MWINRASKPIISSALWATACHSSHPSDHFFTTTPNTIFAVVLCSKAVCWRELNVEQSPLFLPALVWLGMNVLETSRTEEPCGTSGGPALPGLSRCAVIAEGSSRRCQSVQRLDPNDRLKHYLCRFVLVCRFPLCIVVIFVLKCVMFHVGE